MLGDAVWHCHVLGPVFAAVGVARCVSFIELGVTCTQGRVKLV